MLRNLVGLYPRELSFKKCERNRLDMIKIKKNDEEYNEGRFTVYQYRYRKADQFEEGLLLSLLKYLKINHEIKEVSTTNLAGDLLPFVSFEDSTDSISVVTITKNSFVPLINKIIKFAVYKAFKEDGLMITKEVIEEDLILAKIEDFSMVLKFVEFFEYEKGNPYSLFTSSMSYLRYKNNGNAFREAMQGMGISNIIQVGDKFERLLTLVENYAINSAEDEDSIFFQIKKDMVAIVLHCFIQSLYRCYPKSMLIQNSVLQLNNIEDFLYIDREEEVEAYSFKTQDAFKIELKVVEIAPIKCPKESPLRSFKEYLSRIPLDYYFTGGAISVAAAAVLINRFEKE